MIHIVSTIELKLHFVWMFMLKQIDIIIDIIEINNEKKKTSCLKLSFEAFEWWIKEKT